MSKRKLIHLLDQELDEYMEHMPKKIHLDIEINSITDLIKLGKTYDSRTEYNIDMKKIHYLVEPLEQLESMVGMTNVKEQILNQIIYCLQNFHHNEKLHTIIVGPPGVGKTELARIIGSIYYHMGAIPENKFNQVKVGNMIGNYIGQTNSITKQVIENSLGGCLFIDEAYSIGNNYNYGNNCLDVLNQALLEEDFICIIAGYQNELDKYFFNLNPGLRRRFSFKFEINGYTGKELGQIFIKKVKNFGWKFTGDLFFFEENIDAFPFYGGDIDTLFQMCKITHSRRVFCKDNNIKGILTNNDLKSAFTRYKINRQIESETKEYLSMFL